MPAPAAFLPKHLYIAQEEGTHASGEWTDLKGAAEYKPHVLAYKFMPILHACSIILYKVFP